jgi:hypothetical protein
MQFSGKVVWRKKRQTALRGEFCRSATLLGRINKFLPLPMILLRKHWQSADSSEKQRQPKTFTERCKT